MNCLFEGRIKNDEYYDLKMIKLGMYRKMYLSVGMRIGGGGRCMYSLYGLNEYDDVHETLMFGLDGDDIRRVMGDLGMFIARGGYCRSVRYELWVERIYEIGMRMRVCFEI